MSILFTKDKFRSINIIKQIMLNDTDSSYDNIEEHFKVTAYNVMIEMRRGLLCLGVEWSTDGEGFEATSKFSIPESVSYDINDTETNKIAQYREMFITGSPIVAHDIITNGCNIYSDKFVNNIRKNGVNETLEKMFDVYKADIPEPVKGIFDSYDEYTMIQFVKFNIYEINVINDVLNSISKYKKSTNGLFTIDDINILYDLRYKAHNSDRYFCKVRKGEVWTKGQAILANTEFDFNMASIRVSALHNK